MQSTPPPTGEAEDPNRFVTFTGTISRGDLVVPIRFRVRFALDGELRFRVYPLRMTLPAMALRSEWVAKNSSKSALFAISAVSAAGTRFESVGIVIKGSGTPSKGGNDYVTLKLGYTHATFIRDQNNADAPPTIRWTLRGFECAPPVHGTCELGKVTMHGSFSDKGDRISGLAVIRAASQVADTATWIAEAERLFGHLRDVMSFAGSRQVDYPIKDTWVGGAWRRDAYSQTKSRRSNQHVHHPMLMQDVFDAALSSHFDPPVAAKNLGYAIEWLTMQATHSEMRLTNVMTALENLANSNLAASDELYLPPKDFEAFSKRLRDFAGADLQASLEGADESGIAAASEMRSAMKAKLQDLNRRPLFDRVMTLAEQWSVPLAGLDDQEVRAAIVARNNIVHRGYYYEPDRDSRDQADLWDHVLAVRELAIRFVLTIIGFKGRYLSFRGGQHDVVFPPVSPPVATAEADAPAPAS